MKKMILGITAAAMVVGAVAFTNATTKKNETCNNTENCVCCLCTPDCQPGSPNCVCPADCKK